MRTGQKIALYLTMVCFLNISYAEPLKSVRTIQLSNQKVLVWNVLLYPTAQQMLPMHRYDYDRVVVPFEDGQVRITTDAGKITVIQLEKGKSIFLTKNPPNELHTTENLSDHPLNIMVVEIK